MTDRLVPRLLATLAATLLLAACRGGASSPATPPSQPSATVSGSAPPTPVANGLPSPIAPDPGGAVAVIRSTVTAGNPRLLPTYVPSGMTAIVRAAQASYTVRYTDDPHAREITLTVNEGVNPPPYVGSGSQANLQFRGVRTLYTVYDATAPVSQRYLLWHEPGTWSAAVTSMPGIEYFLSATGLTEAEFFRVAFSLQPVG